MKAKLKSKAIHPTQVNFRGIENKYEGSSSKIENQTHTGHFFPRGTGRDFLILTFLFCLAVVLGNPLGDFPLNDDWSYGIAVKRFLESGSYYPTVWTSMSLITQVLWGAIFASLFGFSFEVLRFSTLVLSLIGVLGIYLIARHLKQASWLALIFSLTVAFNPIYFALSNTFMTDVPFMTFCILAILFFVRNLQYNNWYHLLAGSLFTIIAVLCRQNALFVPLAFAVGILFKYGISTTSLLRAFIPLVLSLAALFSFQYWLEATGRTPELYGKQIGDLLDVVSTPALWPLSIGLYGTISLLHVGLFLLPVLVILTLTNRAVLPWLGKAIFPLAVLGTLLMAYVGRLMPLKGSVLNSSGIGPLSLYDTYHLNMPHVPGLPAVFWGIISLLSLMGAGLLLWFLVPVVKSLSTGLYDAITRRRSRKTSTAITLFFFIGAIIYMAPLVFLGFYDRYLIIVMMLLGFAFISAHAGLKLPANQFMPVALLIVLPTALFSIAATHDYFSWNRARWEAIDQLIENENIPAARINGGFEYNGYMLFDHTEFSDETPDTWWEEEDDQYIVTFGPLPDYEVVEQYPYKSWLPHKDHIFILKGEGAPIPQKNEKTTFDN